MAILIKDPETDRIVRELAARTGKTITDAVKTAAERELAGLPPRKGRIDREKLARTLAAALCLATVPAFAQETGQAMGAPSRARGE